MEIDNKIKQLLNVSDEKGHDNTSHDDILFQKCNFKCSENEKQSLCDEMNQFIASNTCHCIQNMIEPQMIVPNTVAVLINVCTL